MTLRQQKTNKTKKQIRVHSPKKQSGTDVFMPFASWRLNRAEKNCCVTAECLKLPLYLLAVPLPSCKLSFSWVLRLDFSERWWVLICLIHLTAVVKCQKWNVAVWSAVHLRLQHTPIKSGCLWLLSFGFLYHCHLSVFSPTQCQQTVSASVFGWHDTNALKGHAALK